MDEDEDGRTARGDRMERVPLMGREGLDQGMPMHAPRPMHAVSATTASTSVVGGHKAGGKAGAGGAFAHGGPGMGNGSAGRAGARSNGSGSSRRAPAGDAYTLGDEEEVSLLALRLEDLEDDGGEQDRGGDPPRWQQQQQQQNGGYGGRGGEKERCLSEDGSCGGVGVGAGGGMEPGHRGGQGPGQQDRATLEMEESFLPTSAKEFQHPFSVGQRRYITAVFTLMASLLFADQNLLAPNLSAAAEFFGFDDTEKDEMLGGYIGAAFFAVGAPAALLVGWYADHVNRRNLLFAVAVFGQAPCLCTIFVKQYWQFFILRVMTGISVGGALPLLYSLLGDLFPSSQRTLVSSFIQIATGAGVFVGQFLAALVGPATDWRLPFVLVAAPSLLVALLMLLTTREPPRGACEEAMQAHARAAFASSDDPLAASAVSPYSEKITWTKVKLLLKVPSNWLIFVQGLPGSLPWGMFISFFNDYIQIKNDFSPGLATLIVSLFGAGNAVGVVGGGALGQWLYNRRKEAMPLLAGACVLGGVAPALFLVNADLSSLFGLAVFVSIVAGVLASVAAPCVKAVTLNVNDPEARGVALAVQAMTDDLGKALGPFIVAGFIRRMGRQAAFNLSVCAWLPCGVLLLCVALCMRKDEDAMQARMKRKLHAADAAAAAAADRVQGLGGFGQGAALLRPLPSGPAGLGFAVGGGSGEGALGTHALHGGGSGGDDGGGLPTTQRWGPGEVGGLGAHALRLGQGVGMTEHAHSPASYRRGHTGKEVQEAEARGLLTLPEGPHQDEEHEEEGAEAESRSLLLPTSHGPWEVAGNGRAGAARAGPGPLAWGAMPPQQPPQHLQHPLQHHAQHQPQQRQGNPGHGDVLAEASPLTAAGSWRGQEEWDRGQLFQGQGQGHLDASLLAASQVPFNAGLGLAAMAGGGIPAGGGVSTPQPPHLAGPGAGHERDVFTLE